MIRVNQKKCLTDRKKSGSITRTKVLADRELSIANASDKPGLHGGTGVAKANRGAEMLAQAPPPPFHSGRCYRSVNSAKAVS